MKFRSAIIYVLLLCWSAAFAVHVGVTANYEHYCKSEAVSQYCDNSAYTVDSHTLPFVNLDNDNTVTVNLSEASASYHNGIKTAFRAVKSVIYRSENMRAQQAVKDNYLHTHINIRPPAQVS